MSKGCREDFGGGRFKGMVHPNLMWVEFGIPKMRVKYMI